MQLMSLSLAIKVKQLSRADCAVILQHKAQNPGLW